MTRVAALYDIHANLPALEAVFAEISDVDVIVIGGDVVWGPWPRETMSLLHGLDLDVRWIMGNADRDVFDRVEGDWKATNDWCADRLTDDDLAFLRALPATTSINGVLYCHGSPRRDTDPLTIGTPEEKVREWCAGVAERTIVCGHTHAQFDRLVGDVRIVNAGSVGEPFGDRGAYWATFDPHPLLQFTPYDVDVVADAIVATGYPYGKVMARNIRTPNAAPAEESAAWFDR